MGLALHGVTAPPVRQTARQHSTPHWSLENRLKRGGSRILRRKEPAAQGNPAPPPHSPILIAVVIASVMITSVVIMSVVIVVMAVPVVIVIGTLSKPPCEIRILFNQQ